MIFLSILLVYLRFKPYVDQPNSSFFDLYGDGFKNYATTLYHIKFDSTYMQYEGMNYPYGEHVLFTDCQPILANSLKFISQNVVDVSDYTVAIVNLTMLFSFVLCSIFLYLIFNRLKLPIWYNILVSLGLTFLAPQLYRVIGHYGLAHSFVVPAILYFLMRFEEKRSWTLSAVTAVFIILTAQLHFYFFAISAVLITAYFFFYWLRNFSGQLTGKLALHYGIQVLTPLIFLQLWSHWGDTVRDRPTLPMGFLDFRAFAEGIFTGSKIPFWQWIDRTIVDIRDLNMENEAFVGTVSTIFALALIVRWCIRRFKKPFLPYVESDFLRNLFPAVFVILLFSLGLPFTLPGMSGLLDHMGPFRQFRGLGRFAWAFYFGWNIIVWYSLYQLAANAKKIWIKGLILVPALSLLAYESFHFAKASYFSPWKDERLIKSRFETSENYWFKNIDIDRYQAVLPIPYYHIGSENFEFGPLGDQLRFSLIPGWHFGIPNLGVFLSRNSYSQTLEHLPLALYPYRPVDLLSRLPNQKPLLVVIDRVQRGNFAAKNDFSYLMRQGKLLYADDLVELYELPVDATIKAAELWHNDVLNGWNYAQENFTLRDGFMCRIALQH
ncbi:MAG: hypothetical protein IPJ74_02945 [Saprospiraceae bacterium]|nr:hypothetical protein [Saprospiraceae bacterium]